MKLWFDALTPKQILFHEYNIRQASQTHRILFTSRNYTEVVQLARIRGLDPIYVGKFGGSDMMSKLDASLSRAHALLNIVKKFAPDLSISSCSPEASRISFGLGIPHIGFCNAPHAEAICRLSIPFLSRLLVPQHIPKTAFLKYGISPSNVIQYQALDEYHIVNNPSVKWDSKAKGLDPNKKTIVFRTYETQASYPTQKIDINSMINALIRKFPDYNIVILGRYSEQKNQLLRTYGNHAIVLSDAVDSGAILSESHLFVGSGGTMTTEAVLRGVPTISYQAVPNYDEAYLLKRGLLVRAKSTPNVIKAATRLLNTGPSIYTDNASMLLSEMKDPYNTLEREINGISPK